eukprot:COSAG01_NODE_30463_length_615_cov_1.350775_1_plen_113_part_00
MMIAGRCYCYLSAKICARWAPLCVLEYVTKTWDQNVGFRGQLHSLAFQWGLDAFACAMAVRCQSCGLRKLKLLCDLYYARLHGQMPDDTVTDKWLRKAARRTGVPLAAICRT